MLQSFLFSLYKFITFSIVLVKNWKVTGAVLSKIRCKVVFRFDILYLWSLYSVNCFIFSVSFFFFTTCGQAWKALIIFLYCQNLLQIVLILYCSSSYYLFYTLKYFIVRCHVRCQLSYFNRKISILESTSNFQIKYIFIITSL